jgi:hypothetical protein
LVPVANVQLLIGTSVVLCSFVMASSVVVHLAQRTYSRWHYKAITRCRVIESVLSNPKVKLRAGQSKLACRPRLVAAALLQDLRNRGSFDDAQIGCVGAR